MAHRPPSYRNHKRTGQAVVTLNGRDHYLGKYGTAESKAKYDRLIAEYLANGRRPPQPAEETPPEVLVCEVLAAFCEYADGHYRTPAGEPSDELANIRHALKPVRKLYGHTPAPSFGPLALRAVREEMIRSGLASTTVNARVNRIRRVFRWAASVEMIPVEVVRALETVAGLQRGRSKARDPGPIKPVPIEHVEATLPHLSRVVAAMARVQLLTGFRAGEVMAMRGCDLEPGEPTWTYRPASHKNAWRGQDRIIPLGPRAVAIVQGFL